MKTTVENLAKTKVKLTVEVSAEELQPAMDKAYKEVGQQVNVPGFRKGHVPPQIIDRRIGRAYVVEQAINSKMSDFYSQALAEAKVQPLAQPAIEVTDIPTGKGEDQKLVFTAEVEIMPEFEIASTDGLKIKVDNVSVSDDDVEAELDQLRTRFGSLKGVERAAQKGDFVSIDMNASVEGEEIDSVSGVSYEVGSGSMMEGMDEALEGMSAGEETDFDTTMRGGDHEGEAGKVHLKLRSVKVRELPQADDDFAQMASEFDTIGELRADLRKNVEQGKAGEQAVQARDRVLEHLRDNTEVPLPEDILKSEIEARVDESASDEEKEEAKKAIEASLKDQLLLDKLVAEKQVQVSQQELLEFIFQTAQAYGIDPSQLLGGENAQQQMSAMAGDMARNKALVKVLREVEVEDEDGNAVDLSEFTKDPAEEEAKATAEAAAEAAAEEAAEEEDKGEEDK
ncbi:trigger factor [Winkia sp. ACRQY]|uniref:trigger factor n=1 Tax=Winkia TaxID=2692118 RepID=UPI001EF24568|nr:MULTISPECIES: trigger factor [Winkia]MCG7302092.1 trigger factor [Winkia sp. ACRQY]MDK8225331.1 trigger factor [Winkia sp. UMB750B]MDK8255882.1 trigger factor [Winkia sp. UMB750A]WEB72035.1 trigger factor [Winkia neuii]